MKQLLLDTNIYGEMVMDRELDQIKGRIDNTTSFLFFGSQIIRDELRDTPKKIKIGGSNLRIDLLSLFDHIVKERIFQITPLVQEIANNYFQAYHQFGGSKGRNEMINDLLIVAIASLKCLDIVVSNDEVSMKADSALKGYELVNSIRKIPLPRFINYRELKQLLR